MTLRTPKETEAALVAIAAFVGLLVGLSVGIIVGYFI